MGTEILLPQDCLADLMVFPGSPVIFPRRTAGKPRSVRKPAVRPDPRRRASEPLQIPRRSAEETPKRAGRNMVMGQVTILRRGESLPEEMIRGLHTPKKMAAVSAADDLFLCGKGRLRPEPASVPVFRTDLYAGTACCSSPAPSDLPLPSFSKKKSASRVIDDSATRDLRRLLRLD